MFRIGTVSRVRSSQVRNGRLIGVFCKRTVFIKGKNSVGNCRLLVVLRNGIPGESFLGVERSSFMILWCNVMAFRAIIPWGMVVFSVCFVQEFGFRVRILHRTVLFSECCVKERLCSLSVLCCNDAWRVAMASSRKIFEPLATIFTSGVASWV